LCAASTSLVADVLAVAEITLPLFELVAAVEPVVAAVVPVVGAVAAPELPAETVEVTGDPSFGAAMGETLSLAEAAEELLGSEPPHAASMQNKAPKAPPRTNIFIVKSS
jgi:hypothetical protein